MELLNILQKPSETGNRSKQRRQIISLPWGDSALGIQLYNFVIKCSSTGTARVLSYEGWAQSQDIHYWCQRSQKIMTIMPVRRRKSLSSLYLDPLEGTKESTSTTGLSSRESSLKSSREDEGLRAKKQGCRITSWFCDSVHGKVWASAQPPGF